MAVSAWTVQIRLNSQTNLPKVLGGVSKALRATGQDADLLGRKIDGLAAKFDRMNGPLTTFAAGMSAAAAASKAAGAATSGVAVSSFIASGAAAARAAQSVSRYAAAMAVVAGYSGGGGRGGAGSRVALGGGFPFYSPMRNVTPLALARGGGGGIMPPSAGGGLGSFGGGRPGYGFPIGGGGGFGGGGALPPGPPVGGGGGGWALPPSAAAFIERQGRRALEAGALAGADAIASAAHMQTALVGVQNATGASNAQIDAMRQKAFNLGDLTAMTAAQSADLLAVIARGSGGVFNDKRGRFDMDTFLATSSTIAEIAKIQNITRHVDTETSANTILQILHQFREYSGAPLQKTADLVTRLSEMMPDSLGVAVRQFPYFINQFKALGMSDTDVVATMAFLDRSGLGRGKGGTNVADLIHASLGGLQLTSHAQAGKDKLLRDMGIIGPDNKSLFFTDKGANYFGFMDQLVKYAATHGRMDTVTNFGSAFGVQGSRIAEMVMDPQIVKQLHNIEDMMSKPALSLFSQFSRYGQTADWQIGRGVKNSQSLLTELGLQALPGVTLGFRQLGDAMHGAQVWLHNNRQVETDITNVSLALAKRVGPAMQTLGDVSLLAYHSIKSFGWEFKILAGAFDSTIWVVDEITKKLNGLYQAWEDFAGRFHLSAGPAGAGGYAGLRGRAHLDPLTGAGHAEAAHHAAHATGAVRKPRQVAVVRHEFHFTGGNGTSLDSLSQKDVKRLARAIMDVASNDVELDSRSGGATPQLVGASHYSIGQGRVS